MSLVAAAVVPGAPLLVPALAGGSADVDEALRTAVLLAVDRLLGDSRGRLVVVGDAPATGEARGTWDWSTFGVDGRGGGAGPALPLALAVGAWLLDRVGAVPDRCYLGVDRDLTPAACAELGRDLGAEDVRLLVVADGSACRSVKAPGYLDARAEPFDAATARALGAADPRALLALDPALARELQAAGRAPWQVLAGASGEDRLAGELALSEAPYGVAYHIASWRRSVG